MTGVLTDAPCGKAARRPPEPIDTMLKNHALWVETQGASGKPAMLAGVDMRPVSGCPITT